MAGFSKKFFFLFVFFLVFSVSAAEKKPEDLSLVRKVADGTLNYSTFELTITGSGIPETNVTNLNSARITAEKAAAANARLKIVKIISGLVLSGKTTVGAYFEGKGDPDFVDRLVNIADIKDVTYERFYSNSSVDLTYKVNVSGYLRKIVEEAREEFSNKKDLLAVSDEAAKTKSVLLINFKTKIEPQLFFSIVNEKGEKIYDISMSKEARKSPASLFFAKKKADAVIEKEKLEGEVLSFSALKISGSEIVIKNSDAEKIAAELKKECFEEGKIIAVSAE
ncbi:hypothetical protein IKS86_00730 [bacterium]|nr:hypothetical protein [bacterium]